MTTFSFFFLFLDFFVSSSSSDSDAVASSSSSSSSSSRKSSSSSKRDPRTPHTPSYIHTYTLSLSPCIHGKDPCTNIRLKVEIPLSTHGTRDRKSERLQGEEASVCTRLQEVGGQSACTWRCWLHEKRLGRCGDIDAWSSLSLDNRRASSSSSLQS